MCAVLETGDRIEKYPDDVPLPSYLASGLATGRILHVVAADDMARRETIVITVYEPDPRRWEADLKTRRRS